MLVGLARVGSSKRGGSCTVCFCSNISKTYTVYQDIIKWSLFLDSVKGSIVLKFFYFNYLYVLAKCALDALYIQSPKTAPLLYIGRTAQSARHISSFVTIQRVSRLLIVKSQF